MKRILLLSTTFYPYPSVGSVRVTNWARALPQLGYQPLIICRDYGYRASRESLAANVHPDVEVMQLEGNGRCAPAEDSMQPLVVVAGTISHRIRNQLVAASLHKLVIPDSQMLFWNRIYPEVLKKASQYRPDVILSTSPSFAVLEVGRRLKRDLSIPWIADYRDSMLPDDRFRPRGWRRLLWPWFAAFESRIYQEADAILHAIPLHGRWARMKYPLAQRRCAILSHFVPDDLLRGTIATIPPEVFGRRAVSVVGFIRPQIVELLAQAIKRLIAEDPQRYDLELRLIGRPLDDPQPLQEILGQRLSITGRLRHDLAKQQIASADVLINAVTTERQRVIGISSKLYEYAAARKPIIAINPTRSDRILLRELTALAMEKPTVEMLCDALRKALAMSSSEVSDSYQEFHDSHSWQRHCQQLQLVLDEVTSTNGSKVDLRELGSLIPTGKS